MKVFIIMEELIKKFEKIYNANYLMSFVLKEITKIEKLIIDDKIDHKNLGQVLDDLDTLETKLIELRNNFFN